MSEQAATIVAAAAPDGEKPAEEKPAPSPDTVTLEEIISNITKLQKGFLLREERHVSHVLRNIPVLRKKLNNRVLSTLLTLAFKGDSSYHTYVSSDINNDGATTIEVSGNAKKLEIGEEAKNYVLLLLVIHLLDTKRVPQAVAVSDDLFVRIRDNKQLASEHLSAKCFFYYGVSHEYNGTSNTIRSQLHGALRTCSLRSDESGQATIINILLRNYLQCNLIEQADLLLSRTSFPQSAGSSEQARYLYYLGRVEALQLAYTESYRHLDLATRKAPPTAYGFHQSVQKIKVIVQLLLGEMPARSLFEIKYLKNSLSPYLKLTQAVRVGDSAKFEAVVKEYTNQFQNDKTYTLILRLHHNVIKTGIRLLCLSYHRISLADVAKKLQLDSTDDAQYIVAKAISDGVIDAEINFVEGYVQSKEVVDIYGTNEPQAAFDQRITFCLKIHNDAVKAMQFPPNAYRKYLETPEQRRERERQEGELAEELGKDEEPEEF